MQGEDLELLLVRLHAHVGQVLLDLARHERVLVQLLGVEQRAAAHALLVGAALHVQHVGVGAALAEGPGGKRGGTLDLSLFFYWDWFALATFVVHVRQIEHFK